MNMNQLRAWATPLVAGAGVLTGTTGVLMFFDARGGLTEPIHEWSGWVLVAAAALHVVVNWRALVLALKRRRATAIAAALGVLTIGAAWPGTHERPPHAFVDALLEAPLSTVAVVAGQTSDELIARLTPQGLRVTDPSQSLTVIARDNDRQPRELLTLALGSARQLRQLP